MLYIVATPLGNLEDLTPRALRIFREVDAIAAEDTRHTIQLLSHFNIAKPLFAFHQHNEREATEQLIERLTKGENIALVSDAGYPCISDAGSYLTQTLRDRNIPYTCLPGACAVDLALVLSGLPTETYAFLGFLPREGKERERAFAKIAKSEDTVVVYESPLRIIKLIKDLSIPGVLISYPPPASALHPQGPHLHLSSGGTPRPRHCPLRSRIPV